MRTSVVGLLPDQVNALSQRNDLYWDFSVRILCDFCDLAHYASELFGQMCASGFDQGEADGAPSPDGRAVA
jgi:hypothetical protein